MNKPVFYKVHAVKYTNFIEQRILIHYNSKHC
jgi:hypothetical protein